MGIDWQESFKSAAHRLRRGPLAGPLKGLRDLAESLSEGERAEECHEIEPLLPEVLAHEAAGEDVDTLYPQVMRHLERCPACLERYAGLVEDMELGRSEGKVAVPKFDLSFLPQKPDLWQLALEVQAQIVEAGRVWLEFFRPLQPAAQGVPVLGEVQADRRMLASMVFPKLQGAGVTVEVERHPGEEQCTVHVRVDSPEWERPEGRPVQLITAAGTRETATDPLGRADFAAVPLADLDGMRVQVTVAPLRSEDPPGSEGSG